MVDFIFTIVFFAILGIFAYGSFNWIQKIELEKEYLQNLLEEQQKSKSVIKKG